MAEVTYRRTGDKILDSLVLAALTDLTERLRGEVEWYPVDPLGEPSLIRVSLPQAKTALEVRTQLARELARAVRSYFVGRSLSAIRVNTGGRGKPIERDFCLFCSMKSRHRCPSVDLLEAVRAFAESPTEHAREDKTSTLLSEVELQVASELLLFVGREGLVLDDLKGGVKRGLEDCMKRQDPYKLREILSRLGKKELKKIRLRSPYQLFSFFPSGMRKTRISEIKNIPGGPNPPPYLILRLIVNELARSGSLNEWSPFAVSKGKTSGAESLYIFLSPYWSKGKYVWDGRYESSSSSVPRQIAALALYGTSLLGLSWLAGVAVSLLLIPPTLPANHAAAVKQLSLARRFVRLTSFGEYQSYILDRRILASLPGRVKYLPILTNLDIPALAELAKGGWKFLLVEFDTRQGMPQNPRNFREEDPGQLARFLIDLGEHFSEFREWIHFLMSAFRMEKHRREASEVLLEIRNAIVFGDPSRLSIALDRSLRLVKTNNSLSWGIYAIPRGKAVSRMIEAIQRAESEVSD